MISERGIVEKIDNQKAIVRVAKSSACAHCGSKDSCNISDRDMLVEVSNELKAGIGDFVEISVPEGTLLRLSVLVYLSPIIALVIGAFLGNFLARPLQIDPSLSAVIGGGLFLGAAFWGLKLYERTEKSGNKYYPRMTRVLSSGVSPQPCDNR
jgi:sigma-E factor negative regulatory protein RseC